MKKAELKQRLSEEVARNEKLQSELKSTNAVKDMYMRERDALKQTVNEMHAMFDGLDGVSPRKRQDIDYPYDTEVSLQARFASYINVMLQQCQGGRRD